MGGRDITVTIDADDNGNPRFKLEVDIEAGWELMIKARGSAKLFGQSSAGQPTPLGDPSFDNVIDLRGASPQLFQALQQQPQLRQTIVQCVQAGAVVTSGDLMLFNKSIPNSAAEIRSYLEPLLDQARRLDDPSGAHHQPATGTASAARVGHIENLPHDQQLPHYQAFIGEVAAKIGQGQAYAKRNDNEVEWRGMYQNVPIRIIVDSFPGVEIHAKVNNPHGEINLEWDKSKGEQQMPHVAWSANDTVYMFVGKGVHFEGAQHEVDLMAARFRHIGVEATDAIVRTMINEQVRFFRIWTDQIKVSFRPNLDEMMDPEGQIVRTGQLVGWLAQKLQATPPDPQVAQVATMGWQAVQIAPPHKITCRYCNTLFLLQGQHYECPNCGAPAQG